MIDGQIILNDGSILENSSIGYSENSIWCFISNAKVSDLIDVFMDAEKIKHLEFNYGGFTKSYDGYTILSTTNQNDNEAQIKLRKKED